ncbi:MAG: APC family permease [Burkholderiales bacterium]|jgi:amino acid transporter|nr:APC family permease [Burkholderiales bacterium]
MAFIESSSNKQPSLFSAIAIGVGCIIGSGWLFASYKASKFAGPIAMGSWVIGAILALLIALLLAEIATYYSKETGLFARLLTLTHNGDYGFIISSSNWFATIITIPAEAEASVQYLAMAFPKLSEDVFNNNHFTHLGIALVCLIMIFYGFLNYWGIKLLAKANNTITVIKLTVPALTAIVFFAAAFHPGNFSSYQGTVAPYGWDKMFTAVVTCGIFYSFYGFSMITVFSKELKNPQRNIPLALAGSVLICLVIYLMLQASFIGAIAPDSIANGWHHLDFTSPLAQLAIILGINWVAIVLYVDAMISPSGTGIIYVGSSARMFTGMAEDKQMPAVFAKEHPIYGISRLSIFVTLAFCMILVVFFDNWDKIMIVVSVFQLISCLAVPIAFCKLRKIDLDKPRPFRMPCGLSLSYIAYLVVSYLLVQCGFMPLLLSLVFHAVFFLIYCSVYYKTLSGTFKAFASSGSMFAYMAIVTFFGYLQENNNLGSAIGILGFLAIVTFNYYFLLNQKGYNPKIVRN